VLDFLQNAKCGDLAFFDDEDGNITHVGILLNESEIIHATESAGGVTIDDIDNAGIVSRLTGKRTHRLRVVKRIVE
jgi:cell wall-associated NlpC family hydrolase